MTRYFKAGLLAVILSLSFLSAVKALGVNPKQVMIEPRIVFVSDKNQRDLSVDYGFVFTPMGENQTKVEATAVAYGRGADFRQWTVESPFILGPNKERILPEKTEKIYIPKPSLATPLAPFLFAAIGSQYEGAGRTAADHPGQVCPVTGKPLGGESQDRGSIAKGIDKAGMAAGMGLLTSQAKGELVGLKTTIIINENSNILMGLRPELDLLDASAPPEPVLIQHLPIVKYFFRAEARNKEKKQLIIIQTPMLIPSPQETM